MKEKEWKRKTYEGNRKTSFLGSASAYSEYHDRNELWDVMNL